MKDSEILKEFEDANAILKGHFILSSGLHSDTYLQCALALTDAKRSEKICSALTARINDKFGKNTFDKVVSPAMGGVVVGYEMGRQLDVPAVFCERVDGEFTFRRGFEVSKGERILIVEDVVTTGKSSLETLECIREHGGNVIAEACIVNRSGNKSPLGTIPLISLLELDIKTYEEDNLPPDLAAIPAIKPGSRWLKK